MPSHGDRQTPTTWMGEDEDDDDDLPVGAHVPAALPHPLGRGRRLLFLALVGIGVGQATGAVALALVVQWAFDRLVLGWAEVATTPLGMWQRVLLVLLLVAAVALTAAGRAGERIVAEHLGQHYVTQVRDQLFEHLTRVPARVIGGRSSGSLLMRFVGDLSALRSWVSLGLARLTVAGVAVTLVLAALLVLAPGIALAVAVVLGAGALATTITSRSLVSTSRRARRHRSRLTGEVSERLSHVGVVQASGQERRERRRVGRKSRRVAEAMLARARAAGAARGVAEATAGLATVAVVLAGAVDVRRGAATPGTVVGALSVVGMLSAYLRDLGRVAEYAAAARVGREAARRFLSLPPLPQVEEPEPLSAGPGRLELRDVSLEPGVRGITATAEAGTVVAVVGPNGAGKSTLVSLAARLVDPEQGSVLLDGQDLTELELSTLRREIGVVSPDLPLIRGSLSRNVRYRHPRGDADDLTDVASRCQLAEVIDALPDGWRSDVGEGGRLLSAGQRARVALARALLGDPRVLVLDEADAHLDQGTRAVLAGAVAARAGTTLVITHRLEVVEAADAVWHLVDGQLVEQGSPAELLTHTGPTARLFAVGRRPVGTGARVPLSH